MGSVMAVALGQDFSTGMPTSEQYVPPPNILFSLDENRYCVAETLLSVLGKLEQPVFKIFLFLHVSF
jgi:hypothetical protein